MSSVSAAALRAEVFHELLELGTSAERIEIRFLLYLGESRPALLSRLAEYLDRTTGVTRRKILALGARFRSCGARRWRGVKRLIDGICELVGARQGMTCQWRNFTATGDLQLEWSGLVHSGDSSRSDQRLWSEWMQSGDFRLDPAADAASRRDDDVATLTRPMVIRDKEYYENG